MFESAADRIARIRDLGGISIRTESGDMCAIFDATAAQVDFEGAHVNSTAPQLAARTEDVLRLGLNVRGARLTAEGRDYTVREHLPDGTGHSVVILDDE